MKTVFVNLERCIGCRQCEFACAVEHSQSRDTVLALFEDPPPRTRIHVEQGPWFNSSFPNRCRHCNPAPCENACPTAAIARDHDHDLVLVDPHKCIACAMCAMVCPFDAITFHPQNGSMPARVVAVKCDGCVNRIRRGREPACVEACKTDALVFGELNDLVKAGRVQESAVALSRATTVDNAPVTPDTIAGWRAWGAAATTVAEEVRHEPHTA